MRTQRLSFRLQQRLSIMHFVIWPCGEFFRVTSGRGEWLLLCWCGGIVILFDQQSQSIGKCLRRQVIPQTSTARDENENT
jgi:hypothetical protein